MDGTVSGQRLRLGLVEGDGLGPEVAGSARRRIWRAATGRNPVALHRSAAMLLRWIAQRREHPPLAHAADRIDRTVAATFAAGSATPDLGGQASTAEFTEQVTARIHRR